MGVPVMRQRLQGVENWDSLHVYMGVQLLLHLSAIPLRAVGLKVLHTKSWLSSWKKNCASVEGQPLDGAVVWVRGGS